MKHITFLLGILLAAAPALAETRTTIIPSRDIFEECFPLKKGQQLTYEFSSPVKLAFNIHYHMKDQTIYVEQQRIQALSGTLTAPETNDYCLMWENKNFSETPLEFEYRLVTDIPEPGFVPYQKPH